MVDHDPEDQRLTSLLRSAHAEHDPVIWTRARARLEADETERGLLGWLMRPAALATSMAVLVLSLGVSTALVLNAEPTVSSGETNISDALLAVPSSPLEDLSVTTSNEPAPAAGTEDTL